MAGAVDNAAEDSAPLSIYTNRARWDVLDGCKALLAAMEGLQ